PRGRVLGCAAGAVRKVGELDGGGFEIHGYSFRVPRNCRDSVSLSSTDVSAVRVIPTRERSNLIRPLFPAWVRRPPRATGHKRGGGRSRRPGRAWRDPC